MSLTKDDILKADDLKREELSVPGWGGTLFVSEWTGEVRDKYEAFRDSLRDKAGRLPSVRGIREYAICLSTVDADGKRLFEDDDWKRLIEKNADNIDVVWGKIRDVNKLGTDAVEETEKNSGSGQNDNSG